MDLLITTIVLWLSSNFDLPAIYDHPRVEFTGAAKIAALRDPGLMKLGVRTGEDKAPKSPQSAIAVYDDLRKVIYLPEGWTGKTAAESSMLVHEMVHHLQNLSQQRFLCPEEREQLAYEAQEKWLKMMGTSITREFELDRFTILVLTHCMF